VPVTVQLPAEAPAEPPAALGPGRPSNADTLLRELLGRKSDADGEHDT